VKITVYCRNEMGMMKQVVDRQTGESGFEFE
jgi:hypothetical protein